MVLSKQSNNHILSGNICSNTYTLVLKEVAKGSNQRIRENGLLIPTTTFSSRIFTFILQASSSNQLKGHQKYNMYPHYYFGTRTSIHGLNLYIPDCVAHFNCQ